MNIHSMLPVVAGLLISGPVFAQPVNTLQSGFIESLIESIESRDGESADYESLLHDLEILQQNPINLNTAEEEDLHRLPVLTDFQIASLIAYRKEHGRLLSIYELGMVYGFNNDIVRKLLPFVTLGNDEGQEFNLDRAIRNGNHELILKTQHVFERASGYSAEDSASGKSAYPGIPWLYYARYGFESSRHIKAGITAEKDPGEEFFNGSNPRGFDFTSGYLMLTGIGPVKSILAGDYRLQFGQGLTLWAGSAPGKSSLSMNIVKRQDAIKAFTATDENDFFRGVAANVDVGKFVLTVFGSSKKCDANITDTLPSGKICFSSFQESGYHRTASEIYDEKSVRETAFGGNLNYRNNWLKAGTTLVQYQFDKYWQKGNDLKDLYDFEGNKLFNWGVDYSATLKRIQLFGETSHGNRGWATLNGALINVNKYASFSILYRNFQPGYFSMHSEAFSDGSSDSNEKGFYAGTVIHPFPNCQVSAYADFYRFPWLSYRVNAPSSGSDYLLQVDYSAGKKTNMFLRFRIGNDPENEEAGSDPLTGIYMMQREGLRYHISVALSDRFMVQDRIELVRVKMEQNHTDNGFMLYQDLQYRLLKIPFTFAFRFAFFNTDSYESRIYAYEQDMSSGFSFSPLYTRGYRTYLMMRYDITRSVSCRLKISQSYFTDKKFIGNGHDMIDGSSRSEIKLQITARF